MDFPEYESLITAFLIESEACNSLQQFSQTLSFNREKWSWMQTGIFCYTEPRFAFKARHASPGWTQRRGVKLNPDCSIVSEDHCCSSHGKGLSFNWYNYTSKLKAPLRFYRKPHNICIKLLFAKKYDIILMTNWTTLYLCMENPDLFGDDLLPALSAPGHIFVSEQKHKEVNAFHNILIYSASTLQLSLETIIPMI